VIRHLESRRHAALPFQALQEGNAIEVAFKVVTPAMINAGETLFRLAVFIQTKQGAAVRAAILETADFTIIIANYYYWRFADEGRAKAAGLRQIRFETEVEPGIALKHAFLLARIDVIALEYPVGNPRHAAIRPRRQSVTAHSCSQAHSLSLAFAPKRIFFIL